MSLFVVDLVVALVFVVVGGCFLCCCVDNFDQEDTKTQYEDDEPQNDEWQAVFGNGDEVYKTALHPRLGAVSVHKGHRIFHHRVSRLASNVGLTECG